MTGHVCRTWLLHFPNEKLLFCSKCRSGLTRYCSRKCQVADWSRHRKMCDEESATNQELKEHAMTDDGRYEILLREGLGLFRKLPWPVLRRSRLGANSRSTRPTPFFTRTRSTSSARTSATNSPSPMPKSSPTSSSPSASKRSPPKILPRRRLWAEDPEQERRRRPRGFPRLDASTANRRRRSFRGRGLANDKAPLGDVVLRHGVSQRPPNRHPRGVSGDAARAEVPGRATSGLGLGGAVEATAGVEGEERGQAGGLPGSGGRRKGCWTSGSRRRWLTACGAS